MGVGMLRRYHEQAPEYVNEPEAQEVTDEQEPVDEAKVDPPAGNAAAEEWRTYAVEQHGADPERVAGMKRDELREQYGPKAE